MDEIVVFRSYSSQNLPRVLVMSSFRFNKHHNNHARFIILHTTKPPKIKIKYYSHQHLPSTAAQTAGQRSAHWGGPGPETPGHSGLCRPCWPSPPWDHPYSSQSSTSVYTGEAKRWVTCHSQRENISKIHNTTQITNHCYPLTFQQLLRWYKLFSSHFITNFHRYNQIVLLHSYSSFVNYYNLYIIQYFYPLMGSATMGRGLTRSSSKRTRRWLPSSLDTSMRSIMESVQNMRRERWSIAMPSGLPRSAHERRVEEQTLHTRGLTNTQGEIILDKTFRTLGADKR